MYRNLSHLICALAALAGFVNATDTVAKSPLRQAEHARELARAGDRDGAIAGYEEYLRANPDNGMYWFRLASSYYAAKRYDDAIAAFHRSADLGVMRAHSFYNIVCCYALMGRTEQALDALAVTMKNRFYNERDLLQTDSDLNSIRKLPRFQEITKLYPPEGLTRDEKWLYDIDYFAKRCKELHYDLYRAVSEADFVAAVRRLKKDVPKLKDHQIIVRLQRILAMTGDGHSRVIFPRGGEGGFHNLRVRFRILGDDMYVIAARPGHRDIIGSRVVELGNVSPKEAMAAVTPYLSIDNPMWIKTMGPFFLTVAEVLDTLGIVDNYNRIPLVVEDADGATRTVDLKAGPLSHMGRIDISEVVPGPAPLWRKNMDEAFWFEHLPERKMVFFQYNSVANTDHETLKDFVVRLFKFIDENEVERLVIDMRHNGGGDNFLNEPLVHALIRSDRINQRGRLFVVIGRNTFSAAINGVIDIERNTNALFVGEPTGSSPNFVGEGKFQTMPNSGVQFNASPVYWQSSTATDERIWLAPDIPAPPTIEHLRTNRDPAMEAIFEYLDEAPTQDASAISN